MSDNKMGETTQVSEIISDVAERLRRVRTDEWCRPELSIVNLLVTLTRVI